MVGRRNHIARQEAKEAGHGQNCSFIKPSHEDYLRSPMKITLISFKVMPQ
jgi:hypothetical protein